MVFVFATGTMMNASESKEETKSLNEVVAFDWDCYDRADFYFEWAQLCGANFEEACDASEASLKDCLK